MLNFLKKSKEIDRTIVAPVDGSCVDITEVPDQTFAGKVLGEGVAFVYEGDTIYAPCSGIVTLVPATRHAIGITNGEGVELLIHVGLETVDLEGRGFEVLVKKDQKVKVGTPLLMINRDVMKENNINMITPMVITDDQSFNFEFHNVGCDVQQGKSIILKYSN